MPLVLLEDGPADGVRVLTLNDPDRRNALSPALQAELGDAVDTVAADPDARVLVVAGNGPAFSAGADLPAVFGELHREVGEIRAGLHAIYDSFLRVRRLEIPTIAAVQGAAVGAGVNLAMTRWAAVDPALARDMKHAVGIAEGGDFDATLDFEAWAQAASTRSPLLAEAIARFSR